MNDFQNEIEPALLLGMYSQKELGIKIITKVNPEDPPDHFATINDTDNVNLELTQLADRSIHEKNSFLNLIHEEVTESIDRHKTKLSNGRYLAFYELGQSVLNEGWVFTVLNKEKIAKSNLANQIDSSIQKLVDNFTSNSNSSKILNEKGKQIGIIHLSLINESRKTEVYVFPQVMQVAITSPEYVIDQIQKTITEKENLYKNKHKNDNTDWWLLIHDLKNYLNADLFVLDINDRMFNFIFFDKILFIRPGYAGFRITDLKRATI